MNEDEQEDEGRKKEEEADVLNLPYCKLYIYSIWKQVEKLGALCCGFCELRNPFEGCILKTFDEVESGTSQETRNRSNAVSRVRNNVVDKLPILMDSMCLARVCLLEFCYVLR